MNREQQRNLENLAVEATTTGMKRVTFIQRALALGLTVPAVASALESLEGPASAMAASASPVQITFGSWGSIDEQITANDVLKVFQSRFPNIQVQPQYTDFSSYFIRLNADLATKSIPDVMFLTYVPTYASKGALVDIRSLAKKHGKDISAYTAGQLFLFEW